MYEARASGIGCLCRSGHVVTAPLLPRLMLVSPCAGGRRTAVRRAYGPRSSARRAGATPFPYAHQDVQPLGIVLEGLTPYRGLAEELSLMRSPPTPEVIEKIAASVSETARIKRETERFKVDGEVVVGWSELLKLVPFRENTIRMKLTDGMRRTGREEFVFGSNQVVVTRLRYLENEHGR